MHRNTIHLVSLVCTILVLIPHITAQECSNERCLYVDGFASIVGNSSEESDLLSFASSHEFDCFLLYELHLVSMTGSDLPRFMRQARQEGIKVIAAVGESAHFFKKIKSYNRNHSNEKERFNVFNLEFEFWTNAVHPGKYYCTTYLQKNGYECSSTGAGDFVIDQLEQMQELASDASYGSSSVSTELYVGWPSASQSEDLAKVLKYHQGDAIRVHAYLKDPVHAVSYTRQRLHDLNQANKQVCVSIIYSAEPAFMQSWLSKNSMESAEDSFTSQASKDYNQIDFEGFTYFAYSHLKKALGSSSSRHYGKQ